MLTSKILFACKFFSNIVNLSCNHHATRDAIDPGLFFQFCDPGFFFVFNNIVDFPRSVQQKERPQPPAVGLLSFYWPGGFLLTWWLFFQFCDKRKGMKGMVLYLSRGVPCLWQRHGTQWWATNFVACNLFLSLLIFPTTMQLGQNSRVASGVGLQYGYFL